MHDVNCRFCETPLKHSFVDLGMSPLSNSYLTADQLNVMEPFYPLHLFVCSQCFLVQLPEFQSPEQIFSDYAYFSSYSKSWLEHAKAYVASMVQRFGFNDQSQVVEVASNDGYLLQYFHEQKIPVLGVEPAQNVADVAIAAGIPTETKFFGASTAEELKNNGFAADLLLGNNVLAHVPDINDFVTGLKILLKPHGVITMEFPHLLNMMELSQFDTIYHEHFSYLSRLTVERIFALHGLSIFDVEELSTHGGSLRIFATHAEQNVSISGSVNVLRERELANGLNRVAGYASFAQKVFKVKLDLLEFLSQVKRQGKSVAAYGAPAKGNTLLNHCGIRKDFLDYTVDLSPHKQGLFLPGTRIPILNPDKISETKPDYLLILPWNLKDEIVEQMGHIRNWGGQFILPIPELQVVA